MSSTKPQATKPTSARLCFPQRVYNVLKLCEDTHQEHIVSWVNEGAAFRVHDVKEFECELLPKYFNTQKYSSFTRALCAHGFDCVRTGRQTGIYSHPKFTRNDPEAPSMMKRVKRVKHAKVLNKKISNVSQGDLSSVGGGKRSFMFPSFLNNAHTVMNDDDYASVFGRLYQTVASPIADRTKTTVKAMIQHHHHLRFVSLDRSGGGESTGEQSPCIPIPSSASVALPSSYHIAADYNTTILDQQNQHGHLAHHYSGSIRDDDLVPISSSTSEGNALEGAGFEPLSCSPHTTLNNRGILDHSEDEAFISFWYGAEKH
ncbi:unnamed protein product [Cylindrotheca closterium]|uniref:HSF-type DNA-binding domain-containing protein n=1 Tax=Cylindrotheca closterium TaxID=2856 RepID=A0AAD2G5A0_9STRA|nr:unnamed protein product [Cylindrotheca closterium]